MSKDASARGRILDLLSYLPETGIFFWREDCGKSVAGRIAGCASSDGYVFIRVEKVLYKAHRLAWLFVHGEWPSGDIDHINGDRSDNRIHNLRVCTRGENLQNQRQAQRRSKSGVLGVSFDASRGKWRACIGINGRSVTIGRFETIEEARLAYVREKKKHHPLETISGGENER